MASLKDTIVLGKLTVTDKIIKSGGTNQQVLLANGDTVNLDDLGGGGSATDTNTWRKIQLNGTDKLGTGTSTNPLDIKEGSNMTITESSGTFTFAAKDTTYESKAAASGGTDVSLVTTGEKYTWNTAATLAQTKHIPTAGIGLTSKDTVEGTITMRDLRANLRTSNEMVDATTATSGIPLTSSDRLYPVSTDKSGYLAVYVPWTDTLPTASSSTKGGIKVGTGLSISSETLSLASHASSNTTYGVGTTSNYGHVKIKNGDLSDVSSTDGVAAGLEHIHSQYFLTTEAEALDLRKQDTLVSGTNIKTINSTSLLGSGNITISDTKVKVNPNTDNANYPIVLNPSTNGAPNTGTMGYKVGVTVNPSTGTITAPYFNGALGDANKRLAINSDVLTYYRSNEAMMALSVTGIMGVAGYYYQLDNTSKRAPWSTTVYNIEKVTALPASPDAKTLYIIV